MNNGDTQERGKPSEQITEIVASWPNISVDEGRFNSTSFKLAGREIGHLHPRLADISYPKPLRDQLIADGHTEKHHAVPQHPNGTTFHIESANDVEHVIWLFRLSYLARIAADQNRGEIDADLIGFDVQEELDNLSLSDAVRRAFETAVEA